MEVIKLTPKSPDDAQPLVLVLDDFDGMHKGNESVLKSANRQLGEGDLLAVLFLTYEGEHEGEENKKITPFNEILNRLEDQGVQRIYQLGFSKDGTDDEKEALLKTSLSKLKIKQLVLGQATLVNQLGFSTNENRSDFFSKLRIPTSQAPKTTENGRSLEAKTIRRFIEEGRMEAAQSLLGRPYTITGVVIHGQKLGRQLGFPTVNLGNVESYVYPKPGVYLGVVGIHNDEGRITENWNVLISTGYRPTVSGKSYLIEAYILNYSGDLYDKKVSVTFLRYMRGEIKFEGLDPLIQQMEQDKKDAEALFGMK